MTHSLATSPRPATESLWHVTVLSNLIRGYDKYARVYAKAAIPESTYPDRFFLLEEREILAGVHKAQRLLDRLGLPGDRLVALRTEVRRDELRENQRTNVGRYVERGHIALAGLAWVDGTGRLEPVSIEEASALSLCVLQRQLHPFESLSPRSLSVLPIARGCQAACRFCFSDASASAEQDQARLALPHVEAWARAARARGAERFVITGGGEPGLLPHPLLRALLRAGSSALGRTVLITNAHHLARLTDTQHSEVLADYGDDGLTVLAISRHHHDQERSTRIMSLDTDVAAVARTWRLGRARWPALRLRMTCVLQRGGIASRADLSGYLDWASALGVEEVCFKELYVSTSVESVYHRHAANAWSHAHQVPLSLVLDFAESHGFEEIARLPWGAPVFRGEWRGAPMQIAAYTEPSLLWERSERVARSWNVMAHGRCLVSLEDRASEIALPVPS